MFDITKRVSLDYLGDNWTDCYLEFRVLRYEEVAKIAGAQKSDMSDQESLQFLEDNVTTLESAFVSGKAVSDGKVVDVTKNDLRDFPLEVIIKCLQAVQGEPPPKP